MIVRPVFKVILFPKKVWQWIVFTAIWNVLLSAAFLELKAFFFSAWILGLLILVYVFKQMTDSTMYSCLDNKIQMTRNFPFFFQKEIFYQDIKEMIIHQRIGEAFGKLKSIHLLTHASAFKKSGLFSSSSFPGLIVGSLKIQDAQKLHVFLQEKICLSRKDQS